MKRISRVVAAVVTAATIAVPFLMPSPAFAHASPVIRFPTEGEVLQASPSAVRITFSEPITGGSTALRVFASSGSVRSGSARVNGATVSAPVAQLTPGRYALVWDVVSDDGHLVSAASGFAVRRQDPPASATTRRISGQAITLSGDRVGTRSVVLSGGLSGAIGQVEWRIPGVPAPFTWTLSSGRARGMLPFAGTYAVTIRAYTSATSSKVLTGSIRIRR